MLILSTFFLQDCQYKNTYFFTQRLVIRVTKSCRQMYEDSQLLKFLRDVQSSLSATGVHIDIVF